MHVVHQFKCEFDRRDHVFSKASEFLLIQPSLVSSSTRYVPVSASESDHPEACLSYEAELLGCFCQSLAFRLRLGFSGEREIRRMTSRCCIMFAPKTFVSKFSDVFV